MNKQYSVDEVIRSLESKGCIITTDSPIKKTIYVKLEGVLVPKEIEVQNSHTVNVEKARGLGNRSWGKIDFLKKYHHYSLINLKEYSKNN